jgi:hypothetical protein
MVKKEKERLFISKCRRFCFGLCLDSVRRGMGWYMGGAVGLVGGRRADWITIPLPSQKIKKVSENSIKNFCCGRVEVYWLKYESIYSNRKMR